MIELNVDLLSYDRICVGFSGGKDSVACVLWLLEQGVPADKIELHHHLIDGREGSNLMDWACSEDYCRKFAAAFGMKIYFSWLEGGFEREMNRNNSPKACTKWENPDGSIGSSGGKSQGGTRLKFPQVSADLSVRWCSAYLKIDVMSAVIRNSPRFQNSRTLVVTGERAEESPARAKYKVFEADRADLRDGEVPRHVDHLRPIHKFSTKEVWALLESYSVNAHPAYHAGFGRASCLFCIFGSPNQCASARVIAPARYANVVGYEVKFGKTIKRKENFNQVADKGTPYPQASEVKDNPIFDQPIILPAGEWKLPAGAFAESCGPI
jgi:3'-phosphoadenosine 5'-phosphosulfate sulfotransferase (PAPS reductase)/FAD synthetase